jgi:PhnB protein
MTHSFKPQGYNSVSPYFIVEDALQFIDFVKALFNAEELRRYDNEDGSIMHAEVRIDDSVIMLGEARKQFPATGFWMHVYVPDSLLSYKKALSLGCEGIEEPVNKEGDPDVRGTFKDKWGNYWAVGTQNS